MTTIETYILRGTHIVNLEEFAANHDAHLVSIDKHPREAARWWHYQRDKTYPCEGWISFTLYGVEIMPAEAWTNVHEFWIGLVRLLQDFTTTGSGRLEFSEETVELSVTRSGPMAVINLRGTTHVVDANALTHTLTSGAQAYFTWVRDYIDLATPELDELAVISHQ